MKTTPRGKSVQCKIQCSTGTRTCLDSWYYTKSSEAPASHTATELLCLHSRAEQHIMTSSHTTTASPSIRNQPDVAHSTPSQIINFISHRTTRPANGFVLADLTTNKRFLRYQGSIQGCKQCRQLLCLPKTEASNCHYTHLGGTWLRPTLCIKIWPYICQQC